MTITERLAAKLQIQIDQLNGLMSGGFVSLRPDKIGNPRPSERLINDGDSNDNRCNNASSACADSLNNGYCHNTTLEYCGGTGCVNTTDQCSIGKSVSSGVVQSSNNL
ncbi:MAG: hypothetical protein JSS82_09270 [Bacteroidetes bacterium]|nr:hypothetical protein [Bacteroidota bacterium]